MGSLTVQDQQGTHEHPSQKKKKKSLCKLLNGVIFMNSAIILSCGLHIHIFYVKYIVQGSTKWKNNTFCRFLYDLSYFGKIIYILCVSLYTYIYIYIYIYIYLYLYIHTYIIYIFLFWYNYILICNKLFLIENWKTENVIFSLVCIYMYICIFVIF